MGIAKRELAAKVLGQRLMGGWRQSQSAPRILAYHRVVPRPWTGFPLDEANISGSPDVFEQQLRWLARHYQVVSFWDLLSCEREDRPWPDRALIITFDDGYKDNLHLALPLLKKYGLPATFFIATGYIGGASLFWWDEVAYLVKRTGQRELVIPEIQAAPMPTGKDTEIIRTIQIILAWAKTVPNTCRVEVLNSLRHRCEVEIPAHLPVDTIMNWDEVRALRAAGMEIGSHTVNHPIMNQLTAAQLEFETTESKRKLEQEMSEEIQVFAYPAGSKTRRSPAAEAAVEKAGYAFGVAYDQAIVQGQSRFALPRLHVDHNQSMNLFRAQLNFPAIFLR